MLRAAFPLLLAVTLVFGTIPEGHAGKRVALVIGNSAYQHTRVLPNPKNDATAIAETLKRLGFDSVSLKLDQSYRSMRETIRAFGREARNADVAFVYYAGHGLELARVNYLVPVDARLQTDDDLHYEAVTLDDVLLAVRKARRLRVVILDACRNNPLSSSMELARGITRSVSRGFGRIEPAGDVLVAYAAKHGTVAEDGEGSHSPYAAALLKHLPTPGLDVGFLFRRVRTAVLAKTARRQEPFTYGSLGSESVYLVPPTEDAAEKSALVPTTIGPSEAAEAWGVVEDTKTASDLEAYIKRFPDSFYADLARSRLRNLKAPRVVVGGYPAASATDRESEYLVWSEAMSAGTVAAYRGYLRKFPSGPHAFDIRRRLHRLGSNAQSFAVGGYPAASATDRESEYLVWSEAMSAGTVAAYRGYLRKFPNGPHASDIRRRLRRLVSYGQGFAVGGRPAASAANLDSEYLVWSEAMSAGTVAAYRVYLRKFPNGPHASDIRRRLRRLGANR